MTKGRAALTFNRNNEAGESAFRRACGADGAYATLYGVREMLVEMIGRGSKLSKKEVLLLEELWTKFNKSLEWHHVDLNDYDPE